MMINKSGVYDEKTINDHRGWRESKVSHWFTNNRFDNLLEEAELPNKNQSELNNKPQSLFDRFFTVLGMGGIVIVLTSGVYFILRNFL